jgi:hypothetical protein
LWILACAIVVASIGLNVNSTAVIIGVLISANGSNIGAGFGLGFMTLIYLKDPKQPFDLLLCWFVYFFILH